MTEESDQSRSIYDHIWSEMRIEVNDSDFLRDVYAQYLSRLFDVAQHKAEREKRDREERREERFADLKQNQRVSIFKRLIGIF